MICKSANSSLGRSRETKSGNRSFVKEIQSLSFRKIILQCQIEIRSCDEHAEALIECGEDVLIDPTLVEGVGCKCGL
jgi:hypothetical protein